MKIHRLIVENIASLKGKHDLNFDEIMGNEDIFAITGPTGSGKSSILSAISIALYNKINKENLNPIDLVTRGAAKSRVELFFSVHGNKYQSIWEVSLKTAKGELRKAPKTTIQLYENEKLVDKNCESILGLNFSQFSKTVILNQGKFADFLTSNYKDRRDILETLFDNYKIGILETNLKQKLKTASNNIGILEQVIEGQELPSKEQLEETKSKIEKYDSSLAVDRTKLNSLDKFNTSAQEYLAGLKTIKENKDRVFQMKKQVEESTRLKIGFHEKLQTAKDEYEVVRNNLQSNRPKLLREIEAKAKYDELEGQVKKAETTKNALLKEIETLTDKRSNLKNELIELEERLSNHAKDYPDLHTKEELLLIENDVMTLKESIASYVKKQSELKSILASVEVQNKNLGQLTTEYQRKCAIADSLKAQENTIDEEIQLTVVELQNIQRTHRELIKRRERVNAAHDDQDKRNNQFTEKDTVLKIEEKKLTLITQDLEIIEKQKKLNELQDAINHCIDESIKIHECAVCHGHIESSELIKLKKETSVVSDEQYSKLQKNYLEQSATVKTLRNGLTEIKEDINRIQKLITENDLNALNKEIVAIEKRIDELQSKRIKLPELKLELIRLEDEKSKLESTIKTERDALESQKVLLDEIKETATIAIEHIKTLCPKFEGDAEYIIAKFQTEQVESLKRKNIVDELGATQSKDLEFKNLINATKNKIERIDNDIKTTKADYDKLKAVLIHDSPTAELERLSSLEQNGLKQCTEIEKNIESIASEISTTERHIKQRTDFIDDKLRELLLLKSVRLNCPQELCSIVPGIDTFFNKAESLFNEEVDDQINSITLLIDSVIRPSVDEIRERVDEARTESIKLKEYLRMNENLMTRHAQKIEELKLAKAEFNKYDSLNSLVGRNQLKDYILGIIERELLIGANLELKRICDGRYKLLQKPDLKTGFVFEVEDSFNDGLTRKVSTLSGGETFLVSLAMSMALSEMTRGTCEIDSFFIDEGFGSLDDEALDDALETLMQIRNRGKRIGVISHVQGLTNRISSNIKLSKNKFGESTITINQQDY